MPLPDIMQIADKLRGGLDMVTAAELGCAIAMPLVATLLKLRTERYIKAREETSFGMAFFEYIISLIAPLFAVLFSIITMAAFHAFGIESLILLFALKACVAWFAIRLVVLLSSRQTAGWLIALLIVPVTLLHLFGVWDLTMDALSGLEFKVGSAKLNAFLIFKGVAVVIILQWIAGVSVNALDHRLNRIEHMRASNRALVLKIFQIVLYCVLVILGMQMLGINISVLGVFGGALGVGIGFGLQKIASNFISGIILLFEKSIEIGDLVQFSDGTVGYVRQTYARYTRLEVSDGKEVMIPNEEFITQRVQSWTHTNTRARVEIVLRVVYGTDVALAQKLMVEAAKAHPACMTDALNEPASFVTNFTDTGIEMTLHFWVPNVRDGRQRPRSDVMITILNTFRAHGIAFFMAPPAPVDTHAPPERSEATA